MLKKIFVLVLFGKSLLGMGGHCHYGLIAKSQVASALAAASNNSAAIQEINQKIEVLGSKDSETMVLKKDLDETKKLVKEMQLQIQTQNSVSMQQKSEIMDAITNFTQRTQSLIAESTRQNLVLQSKVDQLLEARKRIESMLVLFETSKTTGWEAAFVQGLKTELKRESGDE